MEKLNRHKLRFCCLLLTAYCLLSVSGCFLKPPAAPSWETTINIPLISQKITLDSLINEIDGIDTIGGGISYSCKIEFDTITIGDIELDTTFSFSESIGLLDIFADMADSLRAHQGDTIPCLPAVSFARDSTIIIDSRLDYCKISEGQLELKLKNMLPITLDSGKVTLKNSTPDSSIIIEYLLPTLPAYDSLIDVISLVGKTLTGTIKSFIELHTDSTNNVLIDTTDYFLEETKLSNLKVSEVSGDLDSLSIAIPGMGYRFKDVEMIPDILLKGVKIAVNLYEQVNFRLVINDTLYETGGRIVSRVIDIPKEDSITSVTWSGDDVDNFLNAHPDSVWASGTAMASGSGSARASDKIWGSIAFKVPLNFKIGSPIDYEPKEPVKIEIDEGTRGTIDEKCVNAMIAMTFENHLPINGTLTLLASEDTLAKWDTLHIFTIPKCPLNPDGSVKTPSTVKDTVSLNEEKLKIFTYSPVFMRFILHLEKTENLATDGYVKATLNDYISFKTLLGIRVLVGEK